ncbi:hypothetical protein G5C65_37665 [Streptomyces sp. SB3404]|uniref:Uncharacterized protein n=2 Tax=Streptomyces boncukensis TaxID=2711219 RepID=A0A6G4X8S1_9ACTN|nr:hypothetical protein [Streptomyces boncukensis]
MRAADRRGGPGHSVLLAVLLALPAIKVAWTVGGGRAAWEVFVVLQPANWVDIPIGMLLSSPLLAAVLAVVVSRVVIAYFAARGAVPSGRSRAEMVRITGLFLVTPFAFGTLMAVFYGPWWGLGTGLGILALRYGVLAAYRKGHRKVVATETAAALLLIVVVLPVAGLASALNGESWAPVLHCTVDDGEGTDRQRVIEMGRQGNGIYGWSTDSHAVVTGTACALDESRVVREPWWRDV